MKYYFIYFVTILLIAFSAASLGQQKNFQEMIIEKESNPADYFLAKEEAVRRNLPINIYLSSKVLIDVLKIEGGEILFSVIKNFAHPFIDGEILNFNQIEKRFDLSKARINYGHGRITDNTGETVTEKKFSSASQLLLVPDWTNDNVMSMDPQTGDLINTNYIPASPGNLASPKQARLNATGFISVSDQITDLVQKYDTLGTYLGLLAPAGGVNTAQLDNMRGHNYRSNGNLVVAVGSSGNQNAIAEFDPSGNYIGQFIATGAGGLNSPFDILFRSNNVLVTGSSSDAVHMYDLNGNYISNPVSGIQFPQQIAQFSGGRIAVAIFSTPSGLGIYDSLGAQISFFTSVTGLRGVYELGSGNYLVTNATGVHEISSVDGTLIRTIVASTNTQYITLAEFGSSSSFPLTVNVADGWNMVSIPGLLPTNQNVTSWWPGKDPAAGVFKFSGGYQPVSAAVPGTGYWMKNVGAQVYNTGDEWPAEGINIAAHDPIPINQGWNLIGVYECPVPASGLTTNPPGLISGSIYKYSGGYVVADTLHPGYGYWVKSTASGFLNVPNCSK